MKKIIEEAAKEAIHKHYNCNDCITTFDCNECGADEYKEGFIAGVKWRESQELNRLTVGEVYEAGVEDTKTKAIGALNKVLDNRVHIVQAIRFIAEFKELINK